jgi:hypothetical protein
MTDASKETGGICIFVCLMYARPSAAHPGSSATGPFFLLALGDKIERLPSRRAYSHTDGRDALRRAGLLGALARLFPSAAIQYCPKRLGRGAAIQYRL